MTDNSWPTLVLEEWQATLATLHMWTQIVGKIRLAQTPLVNHVDFLLEWRGKQAMIRSGWIIEHDSNTPRLTTCYPL